MTQLLVGNTAFSIMEVTWRKGFALLPTEISTPFGGENHPLRQGSLSLSLSRSSRQLNNRFCIVWSPPFISFELSRNEDIHQAYTALRFPPPNWRRENSECTRLGWESFSKLEPLPRKLSYIIGRITSKEMHRWIPLPQKFLQSFCLRVAFKILLWRKQWRIGNWKEYFRICKGNARLSDFFPYFQIQIS